MDATAQEVLSFWLDEVGPEGWYDGAAFDEPIRARFGALWEEARAGRRDRWICAPASCLALVIVLDQFPRNMFRGDAKSFASDRKARAVAKAAIRRGHDLRIEPPARQFFYMPLMHSEYLPDQEKSVRLFLLNAPGENLPHAQAHRAVIRRFSRFPYRNAALGRRSTPKEEEFLAAGGYRAAMAEAGI